MKGWLSVRDGRFALRSDRFYFRLQWGFLTQHLTESSVAIKKYCIHGCGLKIVPKSLKISLELGPLGLANTKVNDGSRTKRVILLADNTPYLTIWVTCLDRARNRHIEHWYSIDEELRAGSNGLVLLGNGKGQNVSRVAIKRIPFYPLMSGDMLGAKLGRIHREIVIQHKAAQGTTFVADVIDVFYDDHCCFIVTEYDNTVSLSKLLEVQGGKLPEHLVRYIIVQLGRCLLSLHQNHIVHTDVKCENVLLKENPSTPLRVLLCDFGFARVWNPARTHAEDSFCRGMVGTDLYMAPEIVQGQYYGFPVDVFSLGAICHFSLVGKFPKATGMNISHNGTTNEPGLPEVYKGLSSGARSFCKALLCEDPLKRLTIAGLLQHRWLRAGRGISPLPRRRPKNASSCRAVFRRALHVISAVRTLMLTSSEMAFSIMHQAHRDNNARRRLQFQAR